jgi:tetratricopeptide (TPR) repeat protein
MGTDFLRKFLRPLFLIWLAPSWALSCATGAQEAPSRLTVAILPFDDLSSGTNSAHWQKTIAWLLGANLREIKSLRILPQSSIDVALRELQVKPAQRLTTSDIQKAGELIEARRVIYGHYAVENNDYKLTAAVVNIGTKEQSAWVATGSSNFIAASSGVCRDILRQMNISTTAEEETKMRRPITKSPAALELLSLAIADNSGRKPISNVVATLRRAVSIDSEFSEAQTALAHQLLLQSQPYDALAMAKRAVSSRPDYSPAHLTLGWVQLANGFEHSAKKEFLEAARLNADDPGPYLGLHNLERKLGKWTNVVELLRHAAELAPHDPRTLAILAEALVRCQKREEALIELRRVERITNRDPMVAQAIADCYALLNDVPLAVKYYEEFIDGAKKVGLEMSLMEHVNRKLEDLRPRLTPKYLPASPPRSFSGEELGAALTNTLSKEQLELVVVPFATTPAMSQWAKDVVGDAGDDMEKARRLFHGLTRHVNFQQGRGARTATEAFVAWSDPKATLTCQDYTFLFMALSRYVGLTTYYALVSKDYNQRFVSHACAAVFIDKKLLLIDPAYNWFGIAHEGYEILDDLRVVALYMVQLGENANEEIALRLSPDWAMPHLSVAINRMNRRQLNDARGCLQAGLKLDSESWLAFFAQACLEASEKNPVASSAHLRRCLELNREIYVAHYFLGVALHWQGKLIEARAEYRAYLEGETEPEFAEAARKAIGQISGKVPALDIWSEGARKRNQPSASTDRR